MADAIPKGYSTLTPYLTVKDAAKAIEFYQSAFGAQEIFRLTMKNGVVGHAELKIGNSVFMISDEFPDWGSLSPKSLGGSGSALSLYTENCDEVFAKAVAAGAEVKMPPSDQFYGDRSAKIVDPFGHVWSIATHIEDVPAEEMQKRMDAMFT
jgi:PhnB protein